MKDLQNKRFNLYDLSTQSRIVRKKNLYENNLYRTISFYDASINSNRPNYEKDSKTNKIK